MAAGSSRDNRYRIELGIASLVVLFDQVTKWLAVSCLMESSGVPVIAGLLNLVHVRNRGAAFGFLNSQDIAWQFWLFLAAGCLSIWVIWHLTRTSRYDRRLFVGLGLILGGAVGNLIDRVRFRAVIDFLDFYVGSWHWPAFNIADCGICLGAGIICLCVLLPPKAGISDMAGK